MRTVCFVLVCLAALPARADTPAQQRLDSGLRHFAAKEYEQAVADFKAGYAIEPRPDLLYAWAQAERLRGNCPAAIRLYEKYLASGVTAEQAKVAADNLARCHKLVGDEPPPPEPTSQPAPPPPPAPKLTPPSPFAPPPWYTDTFGDALVVGGLVAVGAGVFLFATSSGTAGDAPNASTYSEYADKIDSAKTQRTVALVAVGAGVALVGVGVVHYFMPRAPVEVTAWLGGVGVGGTF